VVLLSGEAGVSKSRLTAALMERVGSEPHTRLRYFCSPQHTDSALHAIIGQMERAAGLTHNDTPAQKLDKLDAVLAQSATPQDAARQQSCSAPQFLAVWPQVGRFANDTALLCLARPDQVADHDQPGGNADSGLQQDPRP
jgi:predicted ATPase